MDDVLSLQYWSGQMRVVLLLPMTVAIWLPPVLFVMIAIFADLKVRATCLTRDSRT
jgi:hypothetical protein